MEFQIADHCVSKNQQLLLKAPGLTQKAIRNMRYRQNKKSTCAQAHNMPLSDDMTGYGIWCPLKSNNDQYSYFEHTRTKQRDKSARFSYKT